MLNTKVFIIDGLDKNMFNPFQNIDSDYEDSSMSSKMYEELNKELSDNFDKYSAEEEVIALKRILFKYASYSEGDTSMFILGNDTFVSQFNIDVTCVNYEDVWNGTIVISITYITK